MATQNVFSGTVISRTAPGNLRNISAPTTVTGAALSAAQLVNGLNIAAGAALTLPTAVALAVALPNIQAGDSFEFTCQTTDGTAVTLTASTITIVGLATTAASAGAAASFWIRCTAAPTDAAGTGAAFVAYRK